MPIINSLNNTTIKDLVRLHKPGERKSRGLIIVDGQREIEFGLKAGLKITEIFYCPSLHKAKDGLSLLANKNNFKLTEISEPVFKKICYKENPDGFLAVAQRPQTVLPELKEMNRDILVVVLENVEKPGNLGAIIRSAYAASVDYIIINNTQTDIYNPNVIRASEGYIFKLPPLEISVKDTVKWFKENKIRTLGASTGTKKEYTKANLGGRVAIVLGSEAEGLSSDWLELADDLIKIPMRSDVDSLNVSVSAAVIIFEALRQRRANKKA